jgi:hypothetical protein
MIDKIVPTKPTVIGRSTDRLAIDIFLPNCININ